MTKVVSRGSWGCHCCKTDRGPPSNDTQNDALRKVCTRLQGAATAKPIGAHPTLGCPFAMYQMLSVTHNILSLGLHECIGRSSWHCYMPNCCGAWKDSQMSKWVYLRRSSWTYHQIRKMGPSKRYWQLAIRLEFEVCKIPSISSHIPRPSAGCNLSPNQFRLNVLPEAGNSARGQKLRLKPFWPNSPRRIFLRWNRSKNSGTGSFARFTLNYAWITSSFASVFFSKKWENAKWSPLQFPLQNGWGSCAE